MIYTFQWYSHCIIAVGFVSVDNLDGCLDGSVAACGISCAGQDRNTLILQVRDGECGLAAFKRI
jgi:hypothetical protein